MRAVRRTRFGALALLVAVTLGLPDASQAADSGRRVIDVTLSDAEPAPALTVERGRLTTLTFVDASGAPWPIARIVASEGAPAVERQATHPHVAMLPGRRGDAAGNLVVLLDGFDEPIHLEFARGGPAASRVEVRVHRTRSGSGDGAAATLAAPPVERAQLEEFVRDFLLANPDVSHEALDPARQLLSRTLDLRDELVSAKGVPAAGDLSGAVTVVEFFDYRCGFCKRSLAAIRAVASEPGVRVELREYPILGDESVTASRLALAAGMQGRYLEAHYALMERADGFGDPGLPDELAAALGLDVERLRADLNSQEVTASIDANRALARRLGITGTPAFLVLGPESAQVSPGALDQARLREMIVAVQ